MAEIDSAFRRALAGEGGVVLVRGDAGIGKTRLLEELLASARGEGIDAITGRCYEGLGAPPFWPWTQVLRACLRLRPGLLPSVGDAAALVNDLASDIAANTADQRTTAEVSPASSRFRLFDAVARLVQGAADDRPLLIGLDDLHWSDAPSLHLLRFLTPQVASVRALLVGTYRDESTPEDENLGTILSDLERTPGITRLTLARLTPAASADLASALAPDRLPPSVAASIAAESEGNPFFIEELTRGLLERTGTTASAAAVPRIRLPERLRSVIAQRLESAGEDARRVLRTAAVIGRNFDIGLLGRVLRVEGSPMSNASILEAIDAARARRIVEEVPDSGGLRFCHALVREAIYDGLGGSERVSLHARVGRALELHYAALPDEVLSVLAHHFYEAALAGTVSEAVRYARQAGARALTLAAFEEARLHFRRALQVLDLDDAPPPIDRCSLLVDLAEAELLCGDVDGANAIVRQSLPLSRQLDEAELFARAVVAYRGVWGVVGTADPEHVRLLEEALARLPTADSKLRIRIMGRLATELYWTDQQERRETLGREMLAAARRMGDSAALVAALNSAHWALWRPDNAEERLAIARENVDVADRNGDRLVAVGGLVWSVIDLVELGRMTEARACVAKYSAEAARLRAPHFRWQAGVMAAFVAFIDGRLEEGERLAQEALARGATALGSNADTFFGIQMLQLAWHRGRLDGLRQGAEAFCAQYPGLPAWRAALAFIYAEEGMENEARRELEVLAAGDFATIPRDTNYVVSLSLIAEVCSAVREPRFAEALWTRLSPHRGNVIVVGNAAASFGAVSHYLGRLAALQGREDEARELFREALALYGEMGARALAVHTEYALAAMLAKSADGAARSEARRIAERVRTSARALAMARLEERAAELSTAEPPRAEAPEAARSDEGGRFVASLVVRSEGHYWRIGRPGSEFRIRDGKGIRYIAHLIRNAGVEIPATQLAAVVDSGGEGGSETASSASDGRERSTVSDLGDAGEMLDDRARRAYRRRLEDLREELREAREFNDLGRGEAAQREIDALSQELARAVGLGGRGRKAAAHAERARINVTRTIKTAVRWIGEQDRPIGRYLAKTIRTGTFCSYVPDPDHPVTWQL